MDGTAVARVYPTPQIIVTLDTTAMVVQRRKTGSLVKKDTAAQALISLNHVLLVFTKTSWPNRIVNHASLVISAAIYPSQIIQVTNARLDTIVLSRRRMIMSFLVHSELSIT